MLAGQRTGRPTGAVVHAVGAGGVGVGGRGRSGPGGVGRRCGESDVGNWNSTMLMRGRCHYSIM